MGAIISPENKQVMLPFIKSNFEGLSQREMARRLGVGKTTVNRWSAEVGLEPVKYTVNENFFRTFSREMSYILGFIFTDGNVSWNEEESRRSLTITQSKKDFEHLERIRGIMKSNKPLCFSQKTESYRLIVTNKKLCSDLIRLGVIPKKSLIVDFPKIPRKFLSDFVRGVIDGDGSISYFNRERSPYFTIRVYSGSKKFLIKMEQAIRKELGISSKITSVHGNTYGIRYTCKQAKILAKWIYSDTDLFLKRKFEQYQICTQQEVAIPNE
jgi:transcriptional regulator with XRE-family HTH domain